MYFYDSNWMCRMVIVKNFFRMILKWFKPKPVYIIKELVSRTLPEDSVRDLDLRYISYKEVSKILNNSGEI